LDGNYTDYHGVEVSLGKRLRNRWIGRAGFAYNNAREHHAPAARYHTHGIPMPTLTEPLSMADRYAPQSSGTGSGNVCINAKWQFNANGMYQAP
jgi:hypothetical protein